MHTSRKFLELGYQVIGVDNLNSYYDQSLKENRLRQLEPYENFTFERTDISDESSLKSLFDEHCPTHVVNLAAQAGVRYSLEEPRDYVRSNISGFLNILEECRYHSIRHLIYASSSSVYGLTGQIPFTESDATSHPLNIYAASKKSNELMAHSYSHLFDLPTTGLRFFTVYGPWGRPDMALFLFAKAILSDQPIDLFNYGKMVRDFTFIDDITEAIERLLLKVPERNDDLELTNLVPGTSRAPFRVFNIGNSNPIKLENYVEALEKALGLTAKRNYLPLNPEMHYCHIRM